MFGDKEGDIERGRGNREEPGAFRGLNSFKGREGEGEGGDEHR